MAGRKFLEVVNFAIFSARVSTMKTCQLLLTMLILVGLWRPATAQDTPGYPIEDFLGYTIFNEVEVSPDGRHVALITAADDFAKDRTDVAIWRIDLDEAGRKTGMLRLSRAEGNCSLNPPLKKGETGGFIRNPAFERLFTLSLKEQIYYSMIVVKYVEEFVLRFIISKDLHV